MIAARSLALRLDLLYLQDLLKLPSDSSQMKVTVRQLRGRPGVDNWHSLLQQLQEIGISKFLVDVSTDNLDDFFQHVRSSDTLHLSIAPTRSRLGESGGARRPVL